MKEFDLEKQFFPLVFIYITTMFAGMLIRGEDMIHNIDLVIGTMLKMDGTIMIIPLLLALWLFYWAETTKMRDYQKEKIVSRYLFRFGAIHVFGYVFLLFANKTNPYFHHVVYATVLFFGLMMAMVVGKIKVIEDESH